jgi:hypothetical protein
MGWCFQEKGSPVVDDCLDHLETAVTNQQRLFLIWTHLNFQRLLVFETLRYPQTIMAPVHWGYFNCYKNE